ncbi:hydrogenase, Fe-only [Halobacteroides halobius DSM 5150]|uniref:Hydrogenase, Fe-only n=1 Tax=Halobacteroides halobius (strain ATCC 35273 / DSM 5150 / MD-1) TaxID=748449 RepID=L0KCP1_HALHC|nr:NADH-dependent [FeFe] hydrogenase, group A6 [Halobacteroides halobius]AGB42159.1 hydrogenase, Fe-only [Halobacteroides halobius DSM 5150]
MSTITLTIDGQQVEVEQGSTILDAAKKLEIDIPTLCYHPDLSLFGSCRVCVVENAKTGDLLASCVAPVADGMEIKSHSTKVRRARRTNVELLLANHPNECLTCERSGTCELQGLTEKLGINEIRFEGEQTKHPIDEFGPSIKRDPNKCILCGRCVRTCEEIQGVSALDFTQRGFDSVVTTAFDLPQAEINCANCGQCVTVCPVGALTEVSEVDKVWQALEDENQHVVVQTAPSIQATMGEPFGMEPGTVVTGKLATALNQLGFDRVFSTDFAADLTIMEEGSELLARLEDKESNTPQITSCCPGWVKFCEHNYPELLDNLSTAKSPMSMFSPLAKTYYAETKDLEAEDIYTVSIMPCTAKKFEKERGELQDSGTQDTDAVLTTRELARMIKEAGIKFAELEDTEYDRMMGEATGAGTIFGTTGGVMEAALRTVYEKLTDEELPRLDLDEVRGLKGVKETAVEIGNDTVKVAVAHGLGNAADLLDQVKAGEANYDFIEVMACPAGCVGGGGQPYPASKEIKAKRGQGLYNIDQSDKIRKSHENPEIKKLYEDFLGAPLSEKAHHLLHTNYQKRDKN